MTGTTRTLFIGAALAGASPAIARTYVWPYQMHGSMGTSCAVADFTVPSSPDEWRRATDIVLVAQPTREDLRQLGRPRAQPGRSDRPGGRDGPGDRPA